MVVEFKRLRVGFDQFDISEPSGVDSLARNFEHPRRHIDYDDAPRGPDRARRRERRLSAASCDVEHAIIGARTNSLNQPGR